MRLLVEQLVHPRQQATHEVRHDRKPLRRPVVNAAGHVGRLGRLRRPRTPRKVLVPQQQRHQHNYQEATTQRHLGHSETKKRQKTTKGFTKANESDELARVWSDDDDGDALQRKEQENLL